MRVPEALLSQAESYAGYTPTTISRQLNKHGKDMVDEWNAFVENNFDGPLDARTLYETATAPHDTKAFSL